MPKQTIIIASQFGIDLPHEVQTQPTPSTKLMILLPGRGYTAESPLMRYIGQMGVAHGYDILRVRYGIHRTQVDHWITRIPDMLVDTQAVVSLVMSDQYTSVCVIGKSLGTMIGSQLLSDLPDKAVSAVMLTPVQNAMGMLDKSVPALAIIGTADPAYDATIIQDSDIHTWYVYDDLNHSLEYHGDWERSVNILPEIVKQVKDFVSRR